MFLYSIEGISAGSQVRPGQELGSEFGKGESQVSRIWGKGGEGFNGISVFWRKGRDKSKQSASGVLSWAALPPCLWFGRGFCPYLVVVMVVVALWYVCA